MKYRQIIYCYINNINNNKKDKNIMLSEKLSKK